MSDLLRLEGEKIEVVKPEGKSQVISDEDLAVLLDRSPSVFEDRGSGWSKESELAKGREVAFEVFDTRMEQGNTRLSDVFGERDDS